MESRLIEQTILARRGARLLAIRHLGQAVAAWYALDAGNVLDDAARFAGERALPDLPWEMHKPVVDYLCGRLLVPERRATSS